MLVLIKGPMNELNSLVASLIIASYKNQNIIKLCSREQMSKLMFTFVHKSVILIILRNVRRCKK